MQVEKVKIETDTAPAAIGAYSQAIKLSIGMVWTSGQIALKPDGSGPEGDVAQQTAQVMQNVSAVLEAAGSSLSQVVKTTVYMTDLSRFAEMNSEYQKWVQEPCPARAAVEVCALPRGALVEIEAIALCSNG